jgi:hypothetical protein
VLESSPGEAQPKSTHAIAKIKTADHAALFFTEPKLASDVSNATGLRNLRSSPSLVARADAAKQEQRSSVPRNPRSQVPQLPPLRRVLANVTLKHFARTSKLAFN